VPVDAVLTHPSNRPDKREDPFGGADTAGGKVSKRRSRLLRVTGLVLLGLAVAGALSTQLPPTRRWIDAALILSDIRAGHADSPFKEVTATPTRAAIDYSIDGRHQKADLYLPAAPRAGIVLVPGLTRQGRHDSAVVAFAFTLSRAGFAVLVPDLVNLRNLQVRAKDGTAIADAAIRLAGQLGADQPIGVTAISYAVGPAVLALLELENVDRRQDIPDNARTPAFMVAIGGYYDARSMIAFATTGEVLNADGSTRHIDPNPLAKWVFAMSNAGRLESSRDAALLSDMALRRLRDPDAPIDDLVRELGWRGEAVYTLLENRDPEQVGGLIDRLPQPVQEDINDLDLSERPLARLHGTRFILVHARNDAIIPYAESVRLRHALPDESAELFSPQGMNHADPDGMTLQDGLALLSAVHAILVMRDREPPGQ